MKNKTNDRELLRRYGLDLNYTLCGGTFIYLLLQAITAKAKRRGLNNGGIKESTCFVDLIKLGNKELKIYGDEKTIAQETSKYKYCKIDGAAWLPITEESYIDSLNNQIENDYSAILQNTILWADKYLDLTTHADWLAKALFELIWFDSSIDPENTYLFANSDGSKTSVKELAEASEIRIQPLILGTWHYIINNYRANTEGFDTIEAIAERGGEVGAIRGPRRGGIGRRGIFSHKVLILDVPKKRDFEGMDLPELFAAAVSEVNQSRDEFYPKMLSGETIALSTDNYHVYINNLYDSYKQVKTLLFRQEPRDFESIYLANDIEAPRGYQYFLFGGMTGSSKVRIKNANVETISARTNFIILSGIGGLGKSMMMRHLLLDALIHFEEYRLLPFFIPLKDYTAEYNSLFDFIYDIYCSFCPSQRVRRSREELMEIMESGRCLFLLDGLDEIKSANKSTFEKQLEQMTNGYRNNIYILSSRPYTNYIAFGRFAKMNLLPFSKEQSVALMQKLDIGRQEEKLKQEFTKALEETLYDTHKEFAENPLLLTIMLLTYKSHVNIPVKMHKFYSKAYDTLFTEHDANKLGYRREYKSNLTQDRFAEYFDEFCFLSYQDGNFDPSPEECKEYFTELEAVKEDRPDFTWKDFMDDLTDSVCMMYEEGQKYHFLHRSFQEYFCARYFFRQEESSLWDIAMFFDDMDVKETDKTFAMLYDMKPRPVEDNVFMVFLEKIFTPKNPLFETSPTAYMTRYDDFLLIIYPVIQWDEGEVIEPSVVKPASYIYSFIVRLNEIKESMDEVELPTDSDDIEIVDEFVYFDPDIQEDVVDEEGNIEYSKGDCEELYSRSEVSDEYIELFEEPEIVGTTYRMDMATVLANEAENIEIIELFHREDFPLLKEYKAVYAYYQELINRSAVRKTDLRSKLRRNKH